MEHSEIKSLLRTSLSENESRDVVVKGWVRTKRENKSIAFIALNDGSCVASIQIVA